MKGNQGLGVEYCPEATDGESSSDLRSSRKDLVINLVGTLLATSSVFTSGILLSIVNEGYASIFCASLSISSTILAACIVSNPCKNSYYYAADLELAMEGRITPTVITVLTLAVGALSFNIASLALNNAKALGYDFSEVIESVTSSTSALMCTIAFAAAVGLCIRNICNSREEAKAHSL